MCFPVKYMSVCTIVYMKVFSNVYHVIKYKLYNILFIYIISCKWLCQGNLVRSNPWTSPWIRYQHPKHQWDQWLERAHMLLKPRWTRSSPNLECIHMRHSYYLRHRSYAYSGAKESTVEKWGKKAKSWWRRTKKTRKKGCESYSGRTSGQQLG